MYLCRIVTIWYPLGNKSTTGCEQRDILQKTNPMQKADCSAGDASGKLVFFFFFFISLWFFDQGMWSAVLLLPQYRDKSAIQLPPLSHELFQSLIQTILLLRNIEILKSTFQNEHEKNYTHEHRSGQILKSNYVRPHR